MATILLAAITILLALILIVLVHHIPKEEWIALLGMGLRICWAVLVVLVPVSQAAITIVWEVRDHREPSILVKMIPVFFFFLSFVPLALLNPDHHDRWKAIRLAVQWTLMAFGLLLLAWWDPSWWDPLPPSFTIKQFIKGFINGPIEEILAWTFALVVAASAAIVIRKEWPSLVALTTSNKVVKGDPIER